MTSTSPPHSVASTCKHTYHTDILNTHTMNKINLGTQTWEMAQLLRCLLYKWHSLQIQASPWNSLAASLAKPVSPRCKESLVSKTKVESGWGGHLTKTSASTCTSCVDTFSLAQPYKHINFTILHHTPKTKSTSSYKNKKILPGGGGARL